MFDYDKYWFGVAKSIEGCVMVTRDRILATGRTVPISEGTMIRRELKPMEEHATWDCFLNVLKNNINPHYGMAITMYYWKIPPHPSYAQRIAEQIHPWFVKILWDKDTPDEWRQTQEALSNGFKEHEVLCKFYEPNQTTEI